MKTLAVTTALLLLSLSAHADSVSIFCAKALNLRQAEVNRTDAQMYSLRYERQHTSFFSLYEVGGWVVNHFLGEIDPEMGRSSLYAKVGAGFTVGPEVGAYAKAALSLAAVASPDAFCSSVPQISPEVGIGIRDADHFIQASYVHFSNAGYKGQNVSRDWLGFQIGVVF